MSRPLPADTPMGYVDRLFINELRQALFPKNVIEDKVLCDKAYHTMMQFQECVNFLQSCHEDNPFLSKLLAKSVAAIQEISDAILQGRECQNASHPEHNKHNKDAIVRPMRDKLAEVEHQTLVRQRDLMELMLVSYNHLELENYDGVCLLMGTAISMMKDILPHIASTMFQDAWSRWQRFDGSGAEKKYLQRFNEFFGV